MARIEDPGWSLTICEDVREEVGNKLSFLGVHGLGIVIDPNSQTDSSLPEGVITVLRLVFVARFWRLSGPRQVQFEIIDPDGEIIASRDVGLVEFEGPNMTRSIVMRSLIAFKSWGLHSIEFVVEDDRYCGSLDLRQGIK